MLVIRPVPQGARTIVGGTSLAAAMAADPAPAPQPAPPVAGGARAVRTMVGMPNVGATVPLTPPTPHAAAYPASPAAPGAMGPQAGPYHAPLTGTVPLTPPTPPAAPSAGAVETDTVPPNAVRAPGMATAALGSPAASPARGMPSRAGGTLLGVARPGIAPLAPGVERDPNPPAPGEPDPPNYAPARELGATLGVDALRDVRPPPGWEENVRRKEKRRRAVNLGDRVIQKPRSPVAPKNADEPISRRALAVVVAAGALAFAAVLVAVFWPSAPPIAARPRADSGGREGVELTCKSCPDGTKVTIAGASASVTGGVAQVPLKTALSVGENRLKVEIDRPGSGRDETIGVSVNVAYRIRPDLASLQADRPAFQIVAEAAAGTTVTIDGRKLPLAAGRGVESVDVTEACTGLANDVKTLSRQIPYVVTPDSGPTEQGAVNVSIGVVPLHLDAPVAILGTGAQRAGAIPDPHVITDGPSFVLAGWTMKGAEVLAAGRPITVHADGSFAQVMNVSSVGSTQIEVRARMPGMAPRLTLIRVRRVESIEKAAREIEAEPKLGYREITADIAGSIGKAVLLSGEVVETKKQGYQTVMLLDVSAASGCPGSGCTVRLVQGADNPAHRGDVLRVYGHVARAFSVPGRPDVAEIEVDFTQKGDRK